jgi:hypothetical protein
MWVALPGVYGPASIALRVIGAQTSPNKAIILEEEDILYYNIKGILASRPDRNFHSETSEAYEYIIYGPLWGTVTPPVRGIPGSFRCVHILVLRLVLFYPENRRIRFFHNVITLLLDYNIRRHIPENNTFPAQCKK